MRRKYFKRTNKEEQRMKQEWPAGRSTGLRKEKLEVYHAEIKGDEMQVIRNQDNSDNSLEGISKDVSEEFSRFSSPNETFKSPKEAKKINNFLYGNTATSYDESIGGNPEDNYSLTRFDQE